MASRHSTRLAAKLNGSFNMAEHGFTLEVDPERIYYAQGANRSSPGVDCYRWEAHCRVMHGEDGTYIPATLVSYYTATEAARRDTELRITWDRPFTGEVFA